MNTKQLNNKFITDERHLVQSGERPQSQLSKQTVVRFSSNAEECAELLALYDACVKSPSCTDATTERLARAIAKCH